MYWYLYYVPITSAFSYINCPTRGLVGSMEPRSMSRWPVIPSNVTAHGAMGGPCAVYVTCNACLINGLFLLHVLVFPQGMWLYRFLPFIHSN
jgi:hypothetical protein